ncbi:MAG TPA: type II 3-dehydroquinate dehydratase [Actinomycetota bacterium]|nr:type II 3-dehydroquinate dehydratase [Actinomycetota bacterium]
MKRILVLNGPNLGRLGTRQPEIYGTTTLAELEERLRARGAELGVQVECIQSDDVAALIAALSDGAADAAILNPAALSHYSVSLREAVEGCGFPVFEVHISNIYAREPYRRHSLISPVARGSIVGLGVEGYVLALEAAVTEANRR